eukprot:1240201-Pyramimonas_sp.AAC.1
MSTLDQEESEIAQPSFKTVQDGAATASQRAPKKNVKKAQGQVAHGSPGLPPKEPLQTGPKRTPTDDRDQSKETGKWGPQQEAH